MTLGRDTTPRKQSPVGTVLLPCRYPDLDPTRPPTDALTSLDPVSRSGIKFFGSGRERVHPSIQNPRVHPVHRGPRSLGVGLDRALPRHTD